MKQPAVSTHLWIKDAEIHGRAQDEIIQEELAALNSGISQLPAEDGGSTTEDFANAGADPFVAAVLRKYAERTELPRIRGAHTNLFFGCVSVIENDEPVTVYLSRHWSKEGFLSSHIHIRDWRSQLGAVFDHSVESIGLIEIRRHSLFRREIDKVIREVHSRSNARPALPGFAPELPPGQRFPSSVITSSVDEELSHKALNRVDEDAERFIAREIHSIDIIEEKFARPTTSKMRESVSTIQAEQGEALRMPIDRPLVVNGGPGTGKTLVGLHRAAFVMYQLRAQGIDPSCLVIAPNAAFLDYVNQVVVDLHESDIRQRTLVDLLAGDSIDSSYVASERISGNGTARIKGDLLMVKAIRSFVARRFHDREFLVSSGKRSGFVSQAKVSELVARAKEKLCVTEASVASIRNWLTGELLKLANDALDEERSIQEIPVSGRPLKAELGEDLERNVKAISKISNRCIPLMSPSEIFQDLIFGVDLPVDSEDAVLRAVLLAIRRRSGQQLIMYRDDAALYDEVVHTLGNECRTFDHVVVDEGQELSPMEWRAVSRRVSKGSLTVIGDLLQQLSSAAASSWTEGMQAAGFGGYSLRNLTVSYRVPKPILDAAKVCLDSSEPGLSLEGVREGLRPFKVSCQAPVDGRVIGSIRLRTGRIHLGRASLSSSSKDDRFLIVTVDPRLLKLDGSTETMFARKPESVHGLEFDHVVLVEPADWVEENSFGRRLLFVSMTRATKTLHVLHHRPLPSVLGKAAFDSLSSGDLPSRL